MNKEANSQELPPIPSTFKLDLVRQDTPESNQVCNPKNGFRCEIFEDETDEIQMDIVRKRFSDDIFNELKNEPYKTNSQPRQGWSIWQALKKLFRIP